MKTVLITGATSGFGYSMAQEFLARGNRVIATGRGLTQRKAIFAELQRLFPHALIQKDLDITKTAELDALVAWLGTQSHGLDVLVNNAGFGLFGAVEDVSEAQAREQMEVNFFGTLRVVRAFLPLLRARRGKVFNFSSVLGFCGLPLTGLYCASKYAVEGLSESLSYELRPHGVQVCLIEPGNFKTSFGQKIVWGENSQVPGSAYAVQTANYTQIRAKLREAGAKTDPASVARGVVALAEASRLPLRKRFGKDARATWVMRQLLPDSWFTRMMGFFSDRTFNKGARA